MASGARRSGRDTSAPGDKGVAEEGSASGAFEVPKGVAQYYGLNVQRKVLVPETDPGAVQSAAARGVTGPGGPLPFHEQIQKSFGRHDVGEVRAHVGGPAAEATHAMGAEGYATGHAVVFAEPPSLHTAAHEAAHVVQQRGGVQLQGGVGKAGDAYEQSADAIADRVVRGESVEDLLDAFSGSGGAPAVQQKPIKAWWVKEQDKLLLLLKRETDSERMTWSELQAVIEFLEADPVGRERSQDIADLKKDLAKKPQDDVPQHPQPMVMPPQPMVMPPQPTLDQTPTLDETPTLETKPTSKLLLDEDDDVEEHDDGLPGLKQPPQSDLKSKLSQFEPKEKEREPKPRPGDEQPKKVRWGMPKRDKELELEAPELGLHPAEAYLGREVKRREKGGGRREEPRPVEVLVLDKPNLNLKIKAGMPVFTEVPEFIRVQVSGLPGGNVILKLRAGQSYLNTGKSQEYVDNADCMKGAPVSIMSSLVKGEGSVGDGHHRLIFSALHGRAFKAVYDSKKKSGGSWDLVYMDTPENMKLTPLESVDDDFLATCFRALVSPEFAFSTFHGKSLKDFVQRFLEDKKKLQASEELLRVIEGYLSGRLKENPFFTYDAFIESVFSQDSSPTMRQYATCLRTLQWNGKPKPCVILGTTSSTGFFDVVTNVITLKPCAPMELLDTLTFEAQNALQRTDLNNAKQSKKKGAVSKVECISDYRYVHAELFRVYRVSSLQELLVKLEVPKHCWQLADFKECQQSGVLRLPDELQRQAQRQALWWWKAQNWTLEEQAEIWSATPHSEGMLSSDDEYAKAKKTDVLDRMHNNGL